MTDSKKYVKPKGDPGSLRPTAIGLWVLGLVFEVLGILILMPHVVTLPAFVLENQTLWLIVALGIDFVLVVIGSLLWKRANRIDPPSEKNKVEFFMKTQLGVIIAVIAFLPILVVLLSNKDLDKKSKTWVSALAAILLVLASLFSAEFNPISLEDLQQMEVNAAESDFGQGTVQWSKNSKVYHTWSECPSLKMIYESNLREGVTKAAFEAGKARMCFKCADHFHIIDGVEKRGSD